MGWRFEWRLWIERNHFDERAGDSAPQRSKLVQAALIGLAVIGIIGVVIWRTFVAN